MKLLAAFLLTIWLNLASTVYSRDVVIATDRQLSMPEERGIITRKDLDEYLASKDDMTSGIVDLGKNAATAIGTISQIDFSQSGGQIAWEVTSTVVPIIGACLALIPGVGVVISGVFLGLWSIISPIFAPKKENPLEKMIKEMATRLNKQMDEKLTNLVRLAIYGELARNNYICNKYNYVSKSFSQEFTDDRTLETNDALKVMMYLNDCDNFLKDTAEAFVYDDYADVLWVPGAITTSMRVAFLAEVIKKGHLIGLKQDLIALYFQELQKDIQRQFDYHGKGLDLIWKRNKKQYHEMEKDQVKIASQVEKAACALQNQLYYFDPVLYPYGMPKLLNSTDMFADIKMDEHYTPMEGIGGKIKHLQIFFDVTESYSVKLPERKDQRYDSLGFMNCFLGPMHLTSPSTYWFNFHPMPAENKYSYEFRVLYFQKEVLLNAVRHEVAVPLLTEFNKKSEKFVKYAAVHENVNQGQVEARRRTCLNIEFVFHDHKKYNESKKLIDIPGNARWTKCPYEITKPTWCNRVREMFVGRFKMYSAGTLNHKEELLNPLIAIDDPSERDVQHGDPYNTRPSGFLVGLEIILRPLIG